MERLGGLDTAFLSCETPTTHMHVCGLLVLDTSTMGKGDPYERIRAMLEERGPGIAPMRHRLATVPFNVGRPFWVDDAELDIERHFRRTRLAPPNGDRKLAALAGEFASTQLRRDRPLWEMLLVEGLPDDRVALLIKVHHSTIDGITGANLMGEFFDLAPSSPPAPTRASIPTSRAPNPFVLLGRALLERLVEPGQIVKLLPATVGRIGDVVWRLTVRGKETVGTTVPFTAPRTSFNATVTGERTVAFIDVSLQEVKAARRAFGVTVNDVLTAVVGGALRRYLLGRGELPERPLIAVEPISVHGQTTDVEGTTKLSVMFTTLATDIDDPVERLHTIAASNARAKELHALVGADTLLQWSSHLWFNGFSLGVRLYSRLHGAEHHPVIHNLILSNVPGPPVPLYLAGAHLTGIYLLGPVMDGAGLNVTVLSEEDRVGFGIMACPDLVPDVWQIADAIPEALHEIAGRAGGVGEA